MPCSLNVWSASLLLDPDPLIPSSPSPSLSFIVDDDIVLPPITNLCVTSFPANSDLCDDLLCDYKFPFSLAYAAVDFKSTAMLSMVSVYNALLDSGCTHHIIQDWALFCDYSACAISLPIAALLLP